MLKKIEKLFVAGLAVILPLGITIFVLVWLFNLIDQPLHNIIQKLLGFYIPGMGIAAIIIIIFIAGIVVSNILGKTIAYWLEKTFKSIPLIKTVYSTVKDVFSVISRKDGDNFQQVVLIEFPKKGIKSIGFVTNSCPHICEDGRVGVFIPTTPNPVNGFLVYAREDELEVLEMTVDKGLQLVVSMGTIDRATEEIKKK